MWPESSETAKPLRSGLTTGTCATACCVAAAQGLLAHKFPTTVEVCLPKDKVVSLTLDAYEMLEHNQSLRVSTTKDAGDDPDVTHGASIFVELSLRTSPGILFKSAQGVGTVTREGLSLAVGEPAINPVPRKMITAHLLNAAEAYQYHGGFEVAVGVLNGEHIALKTMNPRLGIIGGLSILGTTGIVRPYSCAAYIASIQQGIDVARKNHITHISATTGSTSEAAIKAHYPLDEMALIEMGDFIGAVLKHLRKAPIARVSICGGFGKISKLANGHMDLNSRASSINFEQLATWAEEYGASPSLRPLILSANTSMQALTLCKEHNIDLASVVCQQALAQARKVLNRASTSANIPATSIELEVWAIDRQGLFVGSAKEVLS